MTTPPNSMSYMGPGAMPGLYDMQNKSMPPEQQLIYLSGQMPTGGVSVHPQYLQQSLTHQFSVRQGAVSNAKYFVTNFH